MKKIRFIFFYGFLLSSTNSFCCTSFLLRTLNEINIYARTMEWGIFNLKSELTVVPRGITFTPMLATQTEGMQWINKYGYTAITIIKKTFVIDGMNEKGLTVGVLYFPYFAKFQDLDIKLENISITNIDLAAYLLGNFADTESIRNKLPTIRVVYNKDLDKSFGAQSQLHLVVTDEKGDSIVIEYINKKLHIYDNQIGVMTNAPSYDWHILNLRNYPTLSPFAISPKKTLDSVDISPFGAGSGMFGLPGDVTPPSRFIRAVAFTHTSSTLTSAEMAINQASRILNNFDIPKGIIKETDNNNFHLNYTQWSVIADINNRQYFYWTEFNRRMRMIDLKKINWSVNKPHTFPLDKKRHEDIDEITL